jgi:2,3-dihydroxyphenylpropionate 1,2-dioxygenase
LLALNESGFDPAVSYRMQVDHGFEQPMSMLLGGIDKRPVVPMFINCVGAPRPSFRRVREYGAAVGRWAVAQNKRTLVIGSGGLSHDPPVGTLDTASPEQFAFMVSGRSPTAEARRLREERTTNAATEFKAGRTNLLPLNEAWDRRMLELFTSGSFDELEKLSDASITQEGGRGGHEIRTWMAAFAAIAEVGPVNAQVLYYNAIPEWIVGMGMVSARAGTAS